MVVAALGLRICGERRLCPDTVEKLCRAKITSETRNNVLAKDHLANFVCKSRLSREKILVIRHVVANKRVFQQYLRTSELYAKRSERPLSAPRVEFTKPVTSGPNRSMIEDHTAALQRSESRRLSILQNLGDERIGLTEKFIFCCVLFRNSCLSKA